MSGNKPQSKTPKLSDTQLIILSEASQRSDGAIVIPARLKGNASNMAVTALLRRRFIEASDDGTLERDGPDGNADNRRFRITDLGLGAIGIEVSGDEVPTEAAAGVTSKRKEKSQKRTVRVRSTRGKAPKFKRPGPGSSKQHALVTLLRRPKGATMDELLKASGWQAHSVRGFLAGTVKSRLGLKLERTKDPKRGSVYRIPN